MSAIETARTKDIILNTDFVAKITTPGDYRDGKLIGFLLRVTSTGTKSFQVHGRIRGSGLVRHTIGKYGAPWTCKSARIEAEQILHLMKTGIDPRLARKELLAAQLEKSEEEQNIRLKKEITVRHAFERWCADEYNVKPTTKKLYKEMIYKHLIDWLDLPLIEITSEMIIKRYDKVADLTIASANNCFRALRRLFNWSLLEFTQRDGSAVISSNPVAILSKRKKWRKLKSRESLIADDDLSKFYTALNLLDEDSRDYFMLLLVTGLRKQEAMGLLWSDVNFKLLSFTVRDTKNGRDHTLPMTDFVQTMLTHRSVKNKGSLNPSKFVFASDSRSGHIEDIQRSQDRVIANSGIVFTPHALRRTFSYVAARVRLGESERKALLNHLARTDITDSHYTPWHINDLREPLKLVEDYILNRAYEKPKTNTDNVIELLEREIS